MATLSLPSQAFRPRRARGWAVLSFVTHALRPASTAPTPDMPPELLGRRWCDSTERALANRMMFGGRWLD